MGAKTERVGGGAAAPLSDDFIGFLHQGLQGGFNYAPQQFGGQTTPGNAMSRANPFQSTVNFGDLIGQYLSGNDMASTASATAFRQQSGEDTKNIQQQFALGGTGFGTPASTGVANYLAKATPAFAAQQGAQQQQMLQNLLGLYSNFSQLGTPQAQTVQKPSDFSNIMSGVSGLAGAAAPFFGPGAVFGSSIFNNVAGAGGGGGAGGFINPNATRYGFGG